MATKPLDVPCGHVEKALHLTRRPQRQYKTLDEAWLDPALHHLLVQLLVELGPVEPLKLAASISTRPLHAHIPTGL